MATQNTERYLVKQITGTGGGERQAFVRINPETVHLAENGDINAQVAICQIFAAEARNRFDLIYRFGLRYRSLPDWDSLHHPIGLC